MAKKRSRKPRKESQHPEAKKNPSYFHFRNIFLTVLYVVLLKLMSTLPVYDQWMQRIRRYYVEFKEQRKILDVETRMARRHGINYLLPHYLKQHLENQPDVVFLLPPQDYLKKVYPHNFWAEPKGFYYFAGRIPTVRIDDPNLSTATHTVVFNQRKQPQLISIQNDEDLQRIVDLFRKS